MFAVKGWAVDPGALKPQTEPFQSSKRAAPTEDGQKPSRKRRRENAQSGQQTDVGKLWEQHIEGKEPVKAKPVAKKEKARKQKSALGDDQSSAAKSGTDSTTSKAIKDAETTDAPAQKSKNKKKSKNDKSNTNSDRQLNDLTQPGKSKQNDVAGAVPLPAAPVAKLTPMQAAMRQKLVSARFRHLNETLYTAPSDTSLGLFNENPEMFEDYHAGFRQQVAVWPENPVDGFIAMLRARGAVRPPKFMKHGRREKPRPEPTSAIVALPRTHGTCIVADLGCGDARLSRTLHDSGDVSRLQLKIHAFDLQAPSPLVTKADIAALPLADGSVDVAVFCLALMGTNWIAFIEEAWRILHWKGELWVAEIKSRFGRVGRGAGVPVEHSVGGKKKQIARAKVVEAKRQEVEQADEQTTLRSEVDGVESNAPETDVSAFVDVLRRRGFVLKEGEQGIDLSNKMFVKMEFIKAAAPTKGKNVPETPPQGSTGPRTKKRFIEDKGDEPTTDDEAKVLKPCLYKIR